MMLTIRAVLFVRGTTDQPRVDPVVCSRNWAYCS